MTEPINPKAAYLAGILDGFRLSRAETLDEAEALIAEINKGDVEARIRAALADPDPRDSATGAEPDPPIRLN